jgi:serine/threonine-protein kinase
MNGRGLSDELDLSGRILGERYDLLARIGTGGMGSVYRARDRELDELVALKVIRGELARDPNMIERFRQEVKLARKVTHVNVARTFELGRDGDIVFCTMELVTGESLTRRLAHGARIPHGEAVAIACALCDGLAAAHAAGVIHRDIKPDNVLLGDDGRVVLADFGVAALAAAGGELSGTPGYMAPEQARGEAATPGSDVYSVGVMLFEMVSGRRAFTGGVTQVLADKQLFERLEPAGEVPPELARVIAHATERDSAKRIASAADLRGELAPWLRGLRIQTEPPLTEGPAADEATVMVLAARESGDPRMYLAEAVFHEVLALLSRAPRIRVLPRHEPGEPARVVSCLEVKDQLVVHVERLGASVVLELPLVFEQVEAVARTIASAILTAVAMPPPPERGAATEAHELTLQARYNGARDYNRAKLAFAQIERAHQLLPDDPSVGAVLAIVEVRNAFFHADAPPDTLERAARAARAAVKAAPQLADPHLACGHVELHSGNPIAAARHYRAAIARAPYYYEAHEYLGRMLLEAGYVDLALARMEMALAIMPAVRGLCWELARAHALEGRWDDYHRVVAELRAIGPDREFARLRYAAWRRDKPAMLELSSALPLLQSTFVPGMMEAMFDIYLHDKWAEHRERALALLGLHSANKRRKVFVAQLIAEMAGYAGDADSAALAVEHAIPHGFFDLHWLDKCPLLECLRAHPQLPTLRAPLKHRAEAILDALYGEQDLGSSDTAIAPSFTVESR